MTELIDPRRATRATQGAAADAAQAEPLAAVWLSSAVLSRLALVVAMYLYAWYFGRAALMEFHAFQSPSFDLGIFDQGVWLLSHFKNPFVTIMGLNLFVDHASYILFFMVPVYWAWPAPEALLVAQTLALALAAIPVFLLAEKVLRHSWLALLPAAAFLLMPAVGWLNLENFHPDCFEVPLLLFALWFMANRRWTPFLVMVFLLLTVKEDVPVLVIPLGIYVAWAMNRRVGLAVIGMAIVWAGITNGIDLILGGAGAGTLDAWRIPFGGLGGLLHATFTRPWDVAAGMLTAGKVRYLVQIFLPVLFLPLLTRRVLIVLPVLLMNLLSLFSYQTNVQYHYTSLTLAMFAGLAVLTLERFRDLRVRRTLVVPLLLAAALSAYLWGPLQWSREPGNYPNPQNAWPRAAAEAVALIPPDAVVSSVYSASSHLAHRRFIYDFPNPFYANSWGDNSLTGQALPGAYRVEYVLANAGSLSGPSRLVYSELEGRGFKPVFEKEGIVLLRRYPAAGG